VRRVLSRRSSSTRRRTPRPRQTPRLHQGAGVSDACSMVWFNRCRLGVIVQRASTRRYAARGTLGRDSSCPLMLFPARLHYPVSQRTEAARIWPRANFRRFHQTVQGPDHPRSSRADINTRENEQGCERPEPSCSGQCIFIARSKSWRRQLGRTSNALTFLSVCSACSALADASVELPDARSTGARASTGGNLLGGGGTKLMQQGFQRSRRRLAA
jgi:hypothetical protein